MPPPKQKPTAPSLPFDSGRAFQPLGGRDEVLRHLWTVDVSECRGALLIVARIAADRGQPVGRKGDEVGDGEAARDVLDVRIEAAVLVNDEHRRQLAAGVRRPNQIALDRAVAFRRLHRFVPNGDPLVVLGHLLGPGVVGLQAFPDGERRQPADGELVGAIEEVAT